MSKSISEPYGWRAAAVRRACVLRQMPAQTKSSPALFIPRLGRYYAPGLRELTWREIPKKGTHRARKRGKPKGASGRRGAPKRSQKRVTKVAKAAKSNRRRSGPATLKRQLNEARARQAATAEILKIVASSPDDVKPVFEAIVVACARLFRCDRSFIHRCDGANFWAVAAGRSQRPSENPRSAVSAHRPGRSFPVACGGEPGNLAFAGLDRDRVTPA